MTLNCRDHAHDCMNCKKGGPTAMTRTVRPGRGQIGERVSCFNCGYHGPLGRNMHEAVCQWNMLMESWGSLEHSAVDDFAKNMRAKLRAAELKGKRGWHDPGQCTDRHLAAELVGHLFKGNGGTFEDIANFAMMLHWRDADPSMLNDVFAEITAPKYTISVADGVQLAEPAP